MVKLHVPNHWSSHKLTFLSSLIFHTYPILIALQATSPLFKRENLACHYNIKKYWEIVKGSSEGNTRDRLGPIRACNPIEGPTLPNSTCIVQLYLHFIFSYKSRPQVSPPCGYAETGKHRSQQIVKSPKSYFERMCFCKQIVFAKFVTNCT
jgi:hypothetical protein